jgi:hypothetical protein
VLSLAVANFAEATEAEMLPVTVVRFGACPLLISDFLMIAIVESSWESQSFFTPYHVAFRVPNSGEPIWTEKGRFPPKNSPRTAFQTHGTGQWVKNYLRRG